MSKEISQGNLVGEKKNKITSDYEFLKEIGSGAFSKVYKVRDKATKLFRCVKKLNKRDFNEEERKKLVDEVKILKELVS